MEAQRHGCAATRASRRSRCIRAVQFLLDTHLGHGLETRHFECLAAHKMALSQSLSLGHCISGVAVLACLALKDAANALLF